MGHAGGPEAQASATALRPNLIIGAFSGDGRSPVEATLINGTSGSTLECFQGLVGIAQWRALTRGDFKIAPAERCKAEIEKCIREFCTKNVCHHNHFKKGKIQKFIPEMFEKLTKEIVRLQWWDGAANVQQAARLVAGDMLPKNWHIGRDGAHQIIRAITEPMQKCPILKALDVEFLSKENSIIKGFTYKLQTTKPRHIVCQQAVLNIDGHQSAGPT